MYMILDSRNPGDEKYPHQHCSSFLCIRRHSNNCSHSQHRYKLHHFGMVPMHNHLYLKEEILVIKVLSYCDHILI